MHLTFAVIQRAWELKDPSLVEYIIQLADKDRKIPDAAPIRDEALTFDRFLKSIFKPSFREQPEETKKAYRQSQLALIEAEDAEVSLPEPLKLYRILFLLWSDDSYYARCTLIEVIRKVPLVYGPWKALKHIYKAAETQHDYVLLGEIAARFDTENKHDISQATITYMTRRAWRYFRTMGESIPGCYPEAVVNILAAYPDNTAWDTTWIANHIFHHNTKNYTRQQFGPIRRAKHYRLPNRAFKESWQRSPEPLLRLMQTARSEDMREYSCEALMIDFPIVLRNIEIDTLLALMAIPVQSQTVDNFIVWALKQASRYEQQQFRELGLHNGVLKLLDSLSADAVNYACDYLRAYARDLPLQHLIKLANKPQKNVHTLAQNIIAERDPRKEVGLDAWGQLLETKHANAFASTALRKHYGRKELSSNWFQTLLLAATEHSTQFAKHYLLELHPLKSLDSAFFQETLTQLDTGREQAWEVATFAMQQLKALGLDTLPSQFVQIQLLNPLTGYHITEAINNEDIAFSTLSIDFCKALAYESDWKSHPFIQSLKNTNADWSKQLQFDEMLASTMREWLSDVRRINPSELGFEWLMQLIAREESHYNQFATQRMIKAFSPADFAPTEVTVTESTDSDAQTRIDLDGQTFVFTGKLMTMTRKEAQSKVTDANGKNASAVNGQLNYLVIGDEGSPLYGNGRKGSKQVKAESLMEGGASLKVISETAFLQMLAGEQREFSQDSIQAGCESLWNMMLDKADTPTGKFAAQYLRQHHPKMALAETDRPVDPGAEIPNEFLSFERFAPLLQHSNTALRHFSLAFARWEFARWQPNSTELIKLCESKHSDTREFTLQALMEEPCHDNRFYSLDASQLEASAVYSFCESKNAVTRQLGMSIIRHHEKFQQADALFQLTESPDRELRAFVVRMLWSQYRRYEITRHWQPYQAEISQLESLQQKKQREKEATTAGKQGLPARPDTLPATADALEKLLARWLYELPPGRLGNERLSATLKPLSASAAKKALIETLRDLALDDIDFAKRLLPLLKNFTRSRGAMEKAACLVAVTRIHHIHPQLSKVA